MSHAGPSQCIAALGLALLVGVATAAPDGWHRTMEEGLQAAKKSGKPVLVVTAWSNEQ